TVGLHAVAEPLRQGRGGRNCIRNQQDQKRASQAHASLSSLRRVRLILRSMASPNLCLFRDAAPKAVVRRFGLLYLGYVFSARSPCIAGIKQLPALRPIDAR